MLPELLQDRAALYVSGAMTAPERENFELVLEFHGELRAHVGELQGAMADWAMTRVTPVATVPAALKARILGSVAAKPQRTEPESIVVTNADGLIEWVNPAFTEMCGYTLPELRGRKPGHMLQGADTDRAAVARIRESLRERRPCGETLINYHKDGTRYRVDIQIAPVLDDEQQPLWFIARERKLPDDRAVSAA